MSDQKMIATAIWSRLGPGPSITKGSSVATQDRQISKCKNCGAGFLLQGTGDRKPIHLCHTCRAKLAENFELGETARQESHLIHSRAQAAMGDSSVANGKSYVAVVGNASSIKILSADFGEANMPTLVIRFDSDFFIDFLLAAWCWRCSVEKIPITEVVEVVVLDEETQKSVTSAIARGIVGSALFGLVGAGAGLVTAKNSREVTIGVRFRDGRSFVGITKPGVANRLQAFMFTHKPNGDQRFANEPKISTEDLTLKLIALASFILIALAASIYFVTRAQ